MIGMSREEIRQRFDEIVAFSEIEKFLDTPVKFYSSGMYVRLAFSVAAHLEPDILILDEVLAVGDAGFQKKSLNKIISTMESGCTVLIVTHGAENLRKLCKRGVMLQDGQVKSFGKIDKVLMDYSGSLPAAPDPRSTVLNEVEVEYARVKQPDDLTSESHFEAEVAFTVTKDLPNLHINFYVEDSGGRYVFHTRTDYGGIENFAKGTHHVTLKIPRLSLYAGAFSTWFRFSSTKEFGEYALDTDREVIEVAGREDDAKCPVDILSEWHEAGD
jgi:lipopolysaccharide transport system ATP-binding protein